MLLARLPSVAPRPPKDDKDICECLEQLLCGSSSLRRLSLVCTRGGLELRAIASARHSNTGRQILRNRISDTIIASSDILSTLAGLAGEHTFCCGSRALEVLACLQMAIRGRHGAALSDVHLAMALQVRCPCVLRGRACACVNLRTPS